MKLDFEILNFFAILNSIYIFNQFSTNFLHTLTAKNLHFYIICDKLICSQFYLNIWEVQNLWQNAKFVKNQ